MRYQIRAGKEFEVDDSRVIGNESKLKLEEAKNRTLIVRVFLGLTVMFLISSAVLGIIDGNFGKLQAVYNVAAVPISGLVGYYFGKKHDQGE